MSKVNVRELARNTSKVIDGIARTHQPALVTRDGLPVAAIVPIDADALDAWILMNSPKSVEGVRLLRPVPRSVSRASARAVTKRPRARGGASR